MSNVKAIEVTARVPYNWASELSEEDGAFFAGLFLNPVSGLRLDQRDAGYVDNDHGGRTSMYDLHISGTEALAYPAIERLLAALNGAGEVTDANAIDLEAGV
jgi:hypothetical protein